MISEDFGDQERCAVCGKEANGDRWFCHFYGEHGRVTLCSPACAEVYLHPPEAVGVAVASQPWDGPELPRIAM